MDDEHVHRGHRRLQKKAWGLGLEKNVSCPGTASVMSTFFVIFKLSFDTI